MDKRVDIPSVVRAFPALAPAAPVAVMLQAGRLHMHFGQTAHMLAASTAVPALLRCCLLASRAWSQQPHSCDGERHDALEMLAFTCHPARDADVPDGAQLMQRVKELVQERASRLKAIRPSGLQANRWSTVERPLGV
jgi:hypothetical protein